MIELNKQFTLTENWGVISETGVRAIHTFLSDQKPQEGDWKKLNPDFTAFHIPTLSYDWEYVWMIEKGEYRGKFAARVSQYYHKNFKLKCPTTFLERLGNIAREHTQDAATYLFEFVDKIDWKQGDFGESFDSCYWWHNEAALDLLRNNGGLAVRFYNTDTGTGKGRAWLANIGSSYVLWNGYGFAGNSTLTIARVVASHLKASYRKISLFNYGKTGGTLYINSGGYLIGALQDIEKIHNYDLRWGDDCSDECHACGDCIGEDDVYWGDDMPYCEDCFYEVFDSCERCGETHYRDDMYYTGDEMVCEYCLDRYYVRCDKCGEYVRKGDAHVKGDETHCDNCYIEDDVDDVDDE